MENSPVPSKDEQNTVPVPKPPTANTPEPFVPYVPTVAGEQATSGEYKDEGWSWGGCMLNWIFLVAVRKYVYLFF